MNIKTDLVTLKEVKKIFEKIDLPDIPVSEDNKVLSNWVASQLLESSTLLNRLFGLISGENKNYYSEMGYEDVVGYLYDFFQNISPAFLELIKIQIQEKQRQNQEVMQMTRENQAKVMMEMAQKYLDKSTSSPSITKDSEKTT